MISTTPDLLIYFCRKIGTYEIQSQRILKSKSQNTNGWKTLFKTESNLR